MKVNNENSYLWLFIMSQSLFNLLNDLPFSYRVSLELSWYSALVARLVNDALHEAHTIYLCKHCIFLALEVWNKQNSCVWLFDWLLCCWCSEILIYKVDIHTTCLDTFYLWYLPIGTIKHVWVEGCGFESRFSLSGPTLSKIPNTPSVLSTLKWHNPKTCQ